MPSDDFNRADSTDVSAGGTIPWVKVVTPDANGIRVNSNNLQTISALDGGSLFRGFIIYDDPAIDDENHDSEVEFVAIADDGISGPAAKFSGTITTDVTGYIALYKAGTLSLYKYVNQSLNPAAPEGTLLDSHAVTFSASERVRIVVVKSGTDDIVSVEIDDVEVMSVTTPAIAVGKPAIVLHTAPDNAGSAVIRWDNWNGDSVAPPAPPAPAQDLRMGGAFL